MLYLEGDFDGALAAVEEALDIDPGSAIGYGLRGEIRLHGFAELEAALADFDRASELDPTDSANYLGAADALWALGGCGEALLRLDRAAMFGAAGPDVSSRKAFCYIALGNLEQARAFAEGAVLGVETVVQRLRALHANAYFAYVDGRYEHAEGLYETVLEVDYRDARGLLGVAGARWGLGEEDVAYSVGLAALKQLDRLGAERRAHILTADPYLAELGEIAIRRMGVYGEEKARAGLDVGDDFAFWRMTEIEIVAWGEPRKEILVREAEVGLEYNHYLLLGIVARNLEEIGERYLGRSFRALVRLATGLTDGAFDDAEFVIEAYESARIVGIPISEDLSLSAARAYNVRGQLYSDVDEDEFALADFEKAVELVPDEAEYRLNFGSALLYLEDADAALAQYAAAAEVAETTFYEAFAHTMIGLALLVTEGPETGLAEMDLALEIDPGNPASLLMRGYMRILTGDEEGGRADIALVTDQAYIEAFEPLRQAVESLYELSQAPS